MITRLGRYALWFDSCLRFRFLLMALVCWGLCLFSASARADTAQVELSFIAGGDDGTIGQAARYEIRYSSTPITQANWSQATLVPDAVPLPRASGSVEIITVSILNALLGSTYHLGVRTRDEAYNWSTVSNSASFYYGLGADVGDDPSVLPRQFALRPNYPNPFNASTRIEFQVPVPAATKITIWNALGQRVRDLVDENLAPGAHQILWDGTDQWGRIVPSGTYFYQLSAGNYSTTRSMTLLK